MGVGDEPSVFHSGASMVMTPSADFMQGYHQGRVVSKLLAVECTRSKGFGGLLLDFRRSGTPNLDITSVTTSIVRTFFGDNERGVRIRFKFGDTLSGHCFQHKESVGLTF